MPKLTLYVKNQGTVERAKKFAETHHTSVSELVEQFLDGLDRDDRTIEPGDAPILRQLQASLTGSKISASDYRKYLRKKYG
jgi:hypothetical protein